MENASKALLMAGGVLIAVLIIGLFIYMFTSMSGVFEEEENIEEVEEIEKYNKEYLSFNRRLLRGVDILSLMNKVNDNYLRHGSVEDCKITVQFTLIEELAAYKKVTYKDSRGLEKTRVEKNARSSLKPGTYSVSTQEDDVYRILFDRSITDIETFNDFKRRVFNCTGVEYNNLGRISMLKFEEQKINYGEGI